VAISLISFLFRHLLNPAKITEIKEFTPATWARAKASEKRVAQAA